MLFVGCCLFLMFCCLLEFVGGVDCWRLWFIGFRFILLCCVVHCVLVVARWLLVVFGVGCLLFVIACVLLSLLESCMVIIG